MTTPPATSATREPPAPSPRLAGNEPRHAVRGRGRRHRRSEQPGVGAHHPAPVQPPDPPAQDGRAEPESEVVGDGVGGGHPDDAPPQRKHGVGQDSEQDVGDGDGDLKEERRAGVLQGIETPKHEVLRGERRQADGERPENEPDVARAVRAGRGVDQAGQVCGRTPSR